MTHQFKKVSVAIGTWNRFEMVCQAIDAALDQTYRVHEIVVYDDCSPDDSYIKLQLKYVHEPRVKILSQPVNTGGVPNWNAAINACEGDYIAWCSDDDRFFKDHIENSINYLENNPDIELVHSDFANITESDTKIFNFKSIDISILGQTEFKSLRFKVPFRINSKNIFHYYLKYFNWPFHPSTLVFTRKLWENVGEFNPRYELADSDWYLNVPKEFNIAFLPCIGALNRRHEDNWSSRMGTANMQTEFFEMVYDKLEDPGYNYTIREKRKLIKKWKNFEFKLLTRIYIAKKRRDLMVESDKAKKIIYAKFGKNKMKMLLFNLLNFALSIFIPFKNIQRSNDK